MVSTKKQRFGKRTALFSLILILSSFTSIGTAPDTTISENNPVLEVTNITNTSVSLSWYQTTCVVDCNTYHLTYFEKFELYQKNITEENYLLVFTATELRVTEITISNLEANSTYSFFLLWVWDWSNLEQEIADSYGGNKMSNVLTINLTNQAAYTNQLNDLSINKLSEAERTTNQIYDSFLIVIITLIMVVYLVGKRK